MTSTSDPGRCFFTAASISAAATTCTILTPAGRARLTGPDTRVTLCPRRAAAAAIAYPIRPEERLLRNLTGSIASLVGPAVTTILMEELLHNLSGIVSTFFLASHFIGNNVHAMKVETLVVGEFQSNCFILAGDAGHGVVIDPGADAALIAGLIRDLKLKVVAYLQTHGHMDHISALAELCAQHPAPFHIHPADSKWAFGADNDWPPFYGVPPRPSCKELPIENGTELSLLGQKCTVISTPGHTPGSVCFHFHGLKLLFTGDTLFAGSVGRTDFPGGSSKALQKSLALLAALPDDTDVYPGHGPKSTIGHEKKFNYFMQAAGR
ncbi:MAG: hypothetical protein C0404_14905 [Verrucomicrobia bacterium]|nr:hypothetical protein [Verrucomicrobiota bacterium]